MRNNPAEILDFWFGRSGETGYGEFRSEWFQKDEAFDREVTDRFGGVYEEATAGGLDGWREEAGSCLALVIALDQFPRNMFRGDARTHATDGKALHTAKHAIDHALDRELPAFQRMFLYMPFMHAEDVDDQRRSVELFEGLAAEPGGPDVTEYAVGHRDIVERFGRFPHRNALLGRETTPEEAEFLTRPGSSF
ncbi:MAG: FIG027190: Putative transmembrane protein [uncultured Rubrobacteraceae bacterium]|uniref:FIG027190: Putative transmembrane protein n=1 Tax=uncultured Rubrobacteraceae bacterium TaxID=349277 RepID=A0A6J4P5A8_9ACTN|nr:MAG: FIG027190: Putative transmembrane protein [uncultured Rubrobacteraceae bacterium]